MTARTALSAAPLATPAPGGGEGADAVRLPAAFLAGLQTIPGRGRPANNRERPKATGEAPAPRPARAPEPAPTPAPAPAPAPAVEAVDAGLAAPAAPRAFRLTGRSYLAMALAPEIPLHQWLVELDHRMARAPGLLAARPVVLDLTGSSLSASEAEWLVEALGRRGVRIMAVEGEIASPRLPPSVSGGRRTTLPEAAPEPAPGPGGEPAPAAPAAEAAPLRGATRIVDGAVRSGQSIENAHGDVIVMGTVASGAEIVAGGSVHVYGALRGRAIAGTLLLAEGGVPSPRPAGFVFCRKLEAELVAVGGYYALADDVPADLRGRAAQARLEDGVLRFSRLD